jgi:signal peptidase I
MDERTRVNADTSAVSADSVAASPSERGTSEGNPAALQYAPALAGMWSRSGVIARVSVQGSSMLPRIQPGDRLRVRAAASVRVGDVVVVAAEGGLVAHRVLGVGAATLGLRGDNVATADAPVPIGRVLGKVCAAERAGGLSPYGRDVGDRLAPIAARLGRPAVALRAVDAVLNDPERADLLLLALVGLGIAADHEVGEPITDASTASVEELRGRALRALKADQDVARRLPGCALRAQLGPLAYPGLASLGDVVPSEMRDELRSQFVAAWSRARELEAIAAEVLEPLARAGIPVLAHKGAALVADPVDSGGASASRGAVYASSALRLAGDLDLSVADADWERACQLTAAVRGRLAAAHPRRNDPAVQHVELDRLSHHDLDLSGHGGRKWQASNLNADAMLSRATQATLGGQPVLVPESTDLLLTVVANAVRRGFSPPRLIADIAALTWVRARDIDWQRFAADSRDCRLHNRAWIALDMAASWFAARVPAELCEPPPDLTLTAFEALLLRRKRARPLFRLPTRLLWSGGVVPGVSAALVTVRDEAARRMYR